MLKDMQNKEPDSLFFLKILLFLILGLIWVFFPEDTLGFMRGIPLGLIIGLLFASHDHFQIDRKIEYAILLIATVLGYIFPLISIHVVF